jgi:hypothetical protein
MSVLTCWIRPCGVLCDKEIIFEHYTCTVPLAKEGRARSGTKWHNYEDQPLLQLLPDLQFRVFMYTIVVNCRKHFRSLTTQINDWSTSYLVTTNMCAGWRGAWPQSSHARANLCGHPAAFYLSGPKSEAGKLYKALHVGGKSIAQQDSSVGNVVIPGSGQVLVDVMHHSCLYRCSC